MTSRNFEQFLTPTPPIVTRFITKALVLSSQNPWPPPPLRRWRHLWTVPTPYTFFQKIHNWESCWSAKSFSFFFEEFYTPNIFILIRNQKHQKNEHNFYFLYLSETSSTTTTTTKRYKIKPCCKNQFKKYFISYKFLQKTVLSIKNNAIFLRLKRDWNWVNEKYLINVNTVEAA